MKFLFNGSYSHNLDNAGRLAIPAKMRENLDDVVWVCAGVGLDDCLVIFPNDAWLEEAEKDVLGVSLWEPGALDMRFMLYANTVQCEIDKQGRILIPPHLRALAKIVDSVVIAGAGDVIQVWEPSAFAEKMRKVRAAPPVLPRYRRERDGAA